MQVCTDFHQAQAGRRRHPTAKDKSDTGAFEAAVSDQTWWRERNPSLNKIALQVCDAKRRGAGRF